MGFGSRRGANKQVFVYQSWPRVCQKSIYLPEQGGRGRPGLKKWLSGRLSPSALSQAGMRVLHHLTWSVTSGAGERGGESSTLAAVFPLFSRFPPDQLWLHLARQQRHTGAGEKARWLPLNQGRCRGYGRTFCPAFDVCEIINALGFHYFKSQM